MDKESHEHGIPAVVLEAYSLLLQQRIVDITEPLKADTNTAWTFKCTAPVPAPNIENLPANVLLRVVIRENFPYVPVDVYPEDVDVSGFPHQDAESRKLCLPEERLAPRDTNRLTCYIKWTIEWLADAATGTLLKVGEPYELPDFSRKLLLPEARRTTREPLIYVETEDSYGIWKERVGTFGTVDCSIGRGLPVIVARRFLDASGALLWEPTFSDKIYDLRQTLRGRWIIVPDIRYRRHRPPQTYRELAHLCKSQGIDLYQILHRAWDENNSDTRKGFTLIGFSIPRTIGGPAVEMQWQPLFFPNRIAEAKSEHGKKRKKPMAMWQELIQRGRFASAEQLPWGSSTNVSKERLCARGGFPEAIRSSRVALFGCGAIGSIVAEQLVRGGLRMVDLFDSDSVQFGNLCRHTLDGTTVGLGKALALARRLQTVSPSARIAGYGIGAPLGDSAEPDALQVVEHTDILIDCTTSDAAFEWLDDYATQHKKRFVMMFINFHADLLTICLSGVENSCSVVYEDVQTRIRAGETQIDPMQYFYAPSKAELVIEGAGCWHPTFPALGTHINMLVASATDVIASHLSTARRGFAAVLRRSGSAVDGSLPAPLIEIAWTKTYD